MPKKRSKRCAATQRLDEALAVIDPDLSREALPDVLIAKSPLPADTRREIVIERDSALGGRLCTTDIFDLREVKAMIGLPDEVAAKKCRYPGSGRRAPRSFEPEELTKAYESDTLSAEMLGFIRYAGRKYIFDDSRPFERYAAIITAVYTRGAGRFDLTSVCFGTLRIRNGWSLTLGSSIQHFCAAALLLEPEARVRRTANADISFNVSEIRVVDPLPDFQTTI